MEFNLAKDIKDKKCFCKYIGHKWKTREYVSPLLNEVADLATQGVEKAEVLNEVLLHISLC